MINVDSLHPNTPLSGFDEQEAIGNFMYSPIRWIRQADEYETLRKVFAIAVAILLSCTIVGLFFVIPGIIEWCRQENNDPQDSPEIMDEVNEFSKNAVVFVNPISALLSQFDNLDVKGMVNGIYITTNETNLPTTAEFLKGHLPPERSIHIGCATWHNFDIMCKRKSDYGLIVDFNPKNADFIKTTIEIVKASETREVFNSTIIAYLNSLQGEERNIFFHNDQQGLPTERIEKELDRNGSWLQSEESYAFIKNLASDERIIAITENITNHKKFSEIRKFLDFNHIAIDTVYLSNICNFMKTKGEKEAFVKSVTHILDNETIFISCPEINQLNSSQKIILHQHSTLGSEILEKRLSYLHLFELCQPKSQ